MSKIIDILSIFYLLLVVQVKSAKILGVFTVASVSHQIVFQPIWKELSLKGHQVTVISPNPLNDPTLTNLTEIDISFVYKKMEEFKQVASKGMDHWAMMSNIMEIFLYMTREIFENESVNNLIKDNSRSFDVVITEIIDPKTNAFAAKFKCPHIGVASLNVLTLTHQAVGNPTHPILHPDFLTPYSGSDLSFFQRIDAVLFEWYNRYFYYYTFMPAINSVVKEYFGSEFPDMQSIEKNVSMLFLNTNPVIHGVRPYGPNVIQFGGGIHIKPPRALPTELKSFLDNATEGVVYFSLGSNVQSVYLPQEKKNLLKETFAKLPYKVLWKFEDDQMEGKPKNVKTVKWLPQQDLLRHPNIKLFITQTGLQSTEEALINGVPILALPFMADQHLNAKSVVKLGAGIQLEFQTLTEESFRSVISEMIENPKYKEKAVEAGKLLKDQPMSGLEKVVWWTEYVIRNKGAAHYRNPRADVSWSEFLILDVIAFLFSSLFITIFAVYKILQYICRLLRKSLKSKDKPE